MACRDLSVFNFVSFSFTVGMVVEIWLVGSATLPSGTITFPEGAVTVGGGGGGVLPLVATVCGGVEPFAAAGAPAEGFLAIRGLVFFGFGAGAGVAVVASAEGAAAVGVPVAGGVTGCGASIVGASACGAGTAGFFFLQPEAVKISAARAIGSAMFLIPPLISSPFQPVR